MTILANLQNLHLTYPHKLIFKNATFTLVKGEKIGVLGLNGHGKSSFLKILAGMIEPDKSVPPFIFDKNANYSVFYIPQELPHLDVEVKNYLYEFFPELKKLRTRLDEIAEKLADPECDFEKLIDEQTAIYEKLHSLREDEIHNKYQNYLKHFEVADQEAKMRTLSGGEQRKVALALGFSIPQEVILWDEPTNHLDFDTIELFEDEVTKSDKTFLIISHDRTLLQNVVERIVHIRHGQIQSFEGTYQAYLTYLQEEEHRQAKALDRLNNQQRREFAWISRGAKARRTKSKKRIEGYDTLKQTISELKQMAHKQVSLGLKGSGRKSKQLISAEDISLKFGNRTLFKGLDLTVCKGDKIALLGPNGAGKSSLLRAFLGEIPVTTGQVRQVEGLSVGYFSQKRDILDPNKTPWQLIGEGIDFVISNTGEKRHVASYLEGFLFSSDEIKRPIGTFSGGEKNRLQLAHFMKHAKDLWIFDEPTNDLDLETIGILEEELKNYQGALIVVGHDRSFIENVTDTCWLLHDQSIEKFEGGFAQAEYYLEALELEKKLKERELANATKNKDTSSKSSNKEKQRYKELQDLIAKQEKVVSDLNHEIETFSYDTAGREEIASLEQKKKRLEKTQGELDQIYEEWLELESKMS